MRIGFDFDNTIVNYDRLFYTVAKEQGLITDNLPINKIAVRDYLRSIGKEEAWTEMQGYVYGARMAEADAYSDVFNVMQFLKSSGHDLFIVSHKTRHPYLGPQYDLHLAAMNWIDIHLKQDQTLLIPKENIFFKLTKDEKISCIKELKCDVFVDDLPEILTAALFPANTKKYLFDPEMNHNVSSEIVKIPSWAELERCFL